MENINHGVILGRRSTDFLGGTIPYEVRNPSGDWIPFLPTGEAQSKFELETMACVSFSLCNSVETQIKLLTGQDVNLSDRFLAKMSGTTHQGNWMYIVADTLRKSGALMEEEWPWPPGSPSWDDYYTAIPDHLKKKALKFLDQYDVAYEWVGTDLESLKYHLKHAPLQVVIPGHAVLGIYCEKDLYKYFDSYDSYQSGYIKTRTSPFLDALKFVITPKKMDVLVRATKDVYRLKDGKKDMFINGYAFSQLDGRWDKIETRSQAELDAIPDGNVLIVVPQE